MEETAGSKLIVKSYAMPDWLVGEIARAAKVNDRSDSAEIRVRLAGSFGRRADGSAITVTASAQQQVGGAA